MACPIGESKQESLRVKFARRLKHEFHNSGISSDAGLLPDRELDRLAQSMPLDVEAALVAPGRVRSENFPRPFPASFFDKVLLFCCNQLCSECGKIASKPRGIAIYLGNPS